MNADWLRFLNKKPPPIEAVVIREEDTVSFLTLGASGTPAASTSNHSTTSTSPTSTTITLSSSGKRIGRPSGTNMKNKKKKLDIEKQCADSIVSNCLKIKSKAIQNGKRAPNGYMEKETKQQLESYGMPFDYSMSKKTIQSRISRGSLTSTTNGPTPPLIEIEKILLPMVIQMGRTNQPLTPPQVIELCNSLIKGTQHEVALM